MKQGVDDLNRIVELLRTRANFDFGPYQKRTLSRRIEQRMARARIKRLADYLNLLHTDAAEVHALCKDLRIRVTAFFRDPESWRFLDREVLASLVAAKAPGSPLRIWVVGCATGEEAYSVAMLAIEQFHAAHKSCPIQIYATDVDRAALQFARAGVYPESIAADVSADRLRRFFTPEQRGYRVTKEIRETLVFAEQNLLTDPPFPRLDLIRCCNVLMHFEPTVQARLVPLLHFALVDGGYLVLGRAEGIRQRDDLFAAASKKWQVYRRVGSQRPATAPLPLVAHPEADNRTSHLHVANVDPNPLSGLAQQRFLEHFAPASVFVNRKCEIIYFRGQTDRYLAQRPGLATQNLVTKARQGLQSPLRRAVRDAIADSHPVAIRARLQRQGAFQRVQILVEPMKTFKEMEGLLLVSFHLLPDGAAALSDGQVRPAQAGVDDTLVRDLESELETMRKELWTTIQEHEAANEQLNVANEELQTMNEELQAINEELQLSKSALQVLNEQLDGRVAELRRANSDLQAEMAARQRAQRALQESEERFRMLLQGVKDYAIFMLDPEGRVTSWNPGAERIKGYTAEEILGKHFSRFYVSEDIAAGRPERALRLAATTGRYEEEGWRVRKDGSRFFASVLLSPVQDENGQPRGFAKVTRDITERKEAEGRLSELSQRLLTSQEEERRRISRELHDGVSQSLAAAAMNLAHLQRAAPRLGAPARSALAESLGLIDQTTREIRTLSYLLHPPLLDETGLLSAMRWYAEGFAKRSGIVVDLDAPPDLGRLPHEIEVALFRVVQESLTNVHRHSGSPTVRIQIQCRDGVITLQVEDHGRGMPDELQQAGAKDLRAGVGIMGMRERVHQLGGRFDIASRAGGTVVVASLPMAAPAPASAPHGE